MGKTESPVLSILRVVSAVLVAIVTGGLGGMFGFLGDFGPSEGPLSRALVVWFFFSLGGLYIGIALPRLWFLAIAVAWTPISAIIGGAAFRIFSEAASYENVWWIHFNTIFVSPVVALIAGYLGLRIQRWWQPVDSEQLD